MQVTLQTLTWPRDSHGLFDYESRNVTKKSLKTTSSCKILRNGNDITLVDTQTKEAPEVVKSLKTQSGNKGYRLVEGDIIKIGRIKFRIREIRTAEAENQSSPPKPLNSILLQTEIDAEQNLENENAKKSVHNLPCRICLENGYDKGNPLIAPCKCAGTMKYVHLKCLQLWLKNRLITKQSENSISFYWKSLDCELCRKQFPNIISLEGIQNELVEIPKPESQYIILEAICKDKNSAKGIHVISANKKSVIKLGRGHDADVRISDISVSRQHAVIRLNGGYGYKYRQYYLEDNGSKFGTLIQINRCIALDSQISIQVGRTVINFSVKKPWNFLPACFRSTINESAFPFDVLPINSGIPLSSSKRRKSFSNNLLHNHQQLGLNSSCEEEEQDLGEIEVLEQQDSQEHHN